MSEPWETIGKANTTLVAGDIVHIREGTYNNQQMKPINSGASGNYIIYENFNGESVILSGHPVLLYLYENDYIKIDGIRMQNCNFYFVLLGGANYNIIQNCTFYNAESYWGSALCKWYVNPDTGAWDWTTTPIDIPNNYNQILNNVFEDAPDRCPDGPDQDCGTAPSDSFRIYCGAYNIIQGNTFGNTAHDGIVFSNNLTNHNIVRGNIFQNTYRRGLTINVASSWNLIEDNIFYDHGLNMQDNPCADSRDHEPSNASGFQCYGADVIHNIFRRNVSDNNGTGMNLGGIDSHAYHNTVNKQYISVMSMANSADENRSFKNNIFSNTKLLGWEDGEPETYVYNWLSYSGTGEDIITNCKITHNAFSGTTTTWRWMWKYYSLAEWEASTSQIYDNLWCPPGFTDEGNRVFTLQSNSPMINAGGWLTNITSSTNTEQTSFVVEDSCYFYDGWDIPGEIGDTIKTQNGEETIIQNINYDTNTLEVYPAINIVNGEGLSLYYEGIAPDIGAFQYLGDVDPCAGVVCPTICIGKDLWSQKCDPTTGLCVADQIIESNSPDCEYNPCEYVVCPDTCIGNDIWSQRCDPTTGLCIPDQLLLKDATTCMNKVPTDESTIQKYLIIGGLGAVGLAMLLMSRNKK